MMRLICNFVSVYTVENGREIICELLCRVKPDFIYRNSKWNYLTAEDDKSPEIDDGALTKLNELLAEHMEGYEKVRIPSVSSDYAFPVLEHSEDRTTKEWEGVKHNRILTGGMRGICHCTGRGFKGIL